MFDDKRIFSRGDPDFPTTRAVQDALVRQGRVEGEGPLARALAPAAAAIGAKMARPFTEADKSLIRKINGYVPPQQLLGILNDRMRADLGAGVTPYTLDQLHAEIAASRDAGAGSRRGWAGLRKLLAEAEEAGTLERIAEQTIDDFAIVFQLTPKQVVQLKDVLLEQTGG